MITLLIHYGQDVWICFIQIRKRCKIHVFWGAKYAVIVHVGNSKLI